MIEIVSKTKKWGTSLAFVIPKDVVVKKHLKPNQEIKVLLEEDNSTLERTFGILRGKIKESTEDIMREIDEELWGE